MEADRVRAQLERILTSAAFRDAGRASNFLRFVVERVLEGRVDEIKESVLAVEVLGRPPSFDSKSDPIVRVEAGRLRDRLGSYYRTQGEADRVLISMPKGGYVPEFSELPQPVSPVITDVLRLSILAPEKTSFESFAVSPDGRKLAFTAAWDDKLTLWVRTLNSLEAKPLAGTEGALYPFWSPDSRSIGFFTQNKLKIIEIAGGPARDVADAVLGRGGSWSPDGIIVFCPRPVGILHWVSVAGGIPTPIFSLDTARGEIAHGFPQFLPDGHSFVYLAASSRPGESSIRTGSLDSANSRVLVSADTSAAYAPLLPGHPGSLLFLSHGALMAQPFDPQRLELCGAPTVLVPEVRHRRWSQASFSVSNNGVLVYQSGSAENQQFSWFDRQGKLLAAIGPRNDWISFSLSPDERHVAFYRDDDPATFCPKVWVMDLSRDGAVFRLTESGIPEPEFTPVWSPDGKEILFSRGDDRSMRLLRQALNGGTGECVLDTQGPKFPTDWSSDGRWVAYGSQAPDYRNMHTWIVSLGASGQPEEPRPFLLHSYMETSACFSPGDGKEAPRWIAYSSNETGCFEVYIRDFPSGDRRWQVSNQGGLLPRWRRDGQELFYLTPDGTLVAVPVQLGGTLEIGSPQTLFPTGLRFTPRYKTWMNQYAVSHDGQRILLNRPVAETTPRALTAVIPW